MRLGSPRAAEMLLPAQTSAALVYGAVPPRRGRFEFGRVAVRYLSRWRLVWRADFGGRAESVKVDPNLRRAREAELKALGARSLVAAHRRAAWRGEGRDFESLRDYVPGDELRHVSWAATARRGKLTTRQYQIERDQTILIALDAGRLMTARIEQETKFDSAIHAALALMSAAQRGGDNADLVDEEGSRELLTSLKLLRPRHLPLVTTIADRDLRSALRETPDNTRDLFNQSVAEEITAHREAALRLVERQGGLALDVTTATLAPNLLETYIRVKERGLL